MLVINIFNFSFQPYAYAKLLLVKSGFFHKFLFVIYLDF